MPLPWHSLAPQGSSASGHGMSSTTAPTEQRRLPYRQCGTGHLACAPIEVFSTDWSFGGGQDECRFGDGADSLRAQADAVERLPAGLEQRDPAFALGAQTADELVAGEVVRMQVAALGRRQHAGTGAGIALVGQRGQA